MIVEADEVFCEGELQDETLCKNILNYTVLAVQNGAVEIVEASRPVHPSRNPTIQARLYWKPSATWSEK